MDLEKNQIIGQFATIYKNVGYPYTSGLILGFIYVSGQKYFTFQELMEQLNLSKSSTSKFLNFLLEIGDISFITKDEKRKRYFYISPEGFVKSQYMWVQSLSELKKIMKKILSFRNDENPYLNTLIEKEIAYLTDIIPFLTKKNDEHFLKLIQKEETNN